MSLLDNASQRNIFQAEEAMLLRGNVQTLLARLP
jgi:hypothetical protein